MTPAAKSVANTATVWILRLAAGAVFTVSGAAKMIDPYGFIYKINDYLAALQLSFSPGVVIFFAFLLSATEFLTGFTLATGSMRRTSVWLALAMMAAMLPLTLWIALTNPVTDCGCFGDFIILSNQATFWKNVALTAALLVLCFRNRSVRGLFTPLVQWIQIALAAAWILVVGFIGYAEQPMIDFRPYPVGKPLLQEAGTEGIIYRYSAPDGTLGDFTADNLPDPSEGWTFVERIDSGDTAATESALAVFDTEGEDVTCDVIGATERQLLLLVPDIDAAGISDSYTANELAAYITAPEREDSPEAFAAIVHASSQAALDEWLDMSMAVYPVYTADDRAIKTVARGKMSLVYLENDTVRWKRILSSINPESIESPGFSLESLNVDGPALFRRYTLILILAELAVMLLGHSVTFLKFMKFLQRRGK